MATYAEIKNKQPELIECFFAFSDKQYKEGIAKHNLEGKKIFRGIGGLFGTQEGIARLYADYDAINNEVTEQCDPQDVYDYEFVNRECSYIGDDTEAMKLVISYFDAEMYSEVKRRCKQYTNEELLEQIKKEAKKD
jgi:hypothetical protein